MSKTIKISYTELTSKIGELTTLRANWDGYSSTVKPSVSGGGMTVSVLDEIGDSYITLYKTVCNLCDNTIQFLNNVNKSVDNTDQESATSIKE